MPADLDLSSLTYLLGRLLPEPQRTANDIQLASQLCRVLVNSVKIPLETSLALVLTLCDKSTLSTVELLIISDRQMVTWTGYAGWVSLDTFSKAVGACADTAKAVQMTTINIQRLKTLGTT